MSGPRRRVRATAPLFRDFDRQRADADADATLARDRPDKLDAPDPSVVVELRNHPAADAVLGVLGATSPASTTSRMRE